MSGPMVPSTVSSDFFSPDEEICAHEIEYFFWVFLGFQMSGLPSVIVSKRELFRSQNLVPTSLESSPPTASAMN